jgi:protein dithiol oxidoreductase (disulfide-forming)
MKSRHALMLSLLLPLLGACSKEPAPTAAGTTETAANPESAAPATATADATATAPAEGGAAVEGSAPNNNPVVPPQGPEPVAGTDYVEIANGQPFEPADGKIEVVEFFNYICPACNAFDPMLQNWKAKLPADVRVTYVPAAFRPDFASYARAYYAADALGIATRSHDAVYKAVHQEGKLPGEGQPIDEKQIAQFYTQYGVSADQFSSTMKSFAVNGRLQKASQFAVRSQIGGTPSIVVAGKYLVKGKSWDDMLRIADHLIARERAAGGAK